MVNDWLFIAIQRLILRGELIMDLVGIGFVTGYLLHFAETWNRSDGKCHSKRPLRKKSGAKTEGGAVLFLNNHV